MDAQGKVIRCCPREPASGYLRAGHREVRPHEYIIEANKWKDAGPGPPGFRPVPLGVSIDVPPADLSVSGGTGVEVEVAAEDHRWNAFRGTEPLRTDEGSGLSHPLFPMPAEMRGHDLNAHSPDNHFRPEGPSLLQPGAAGQGRKLSGADQPDRMAAEKRVSKRAVLDPPHGVEVDRYAQFGADRRRLLGKPGAAQMSIQFLQRDDVRIVSGDDFRDPAGYTAAVPPAAAVYVIGHDGKGFRHLH